MRRKIILVLAATWCAVSWARAEAAEVPRAQLDESERFFTRAYTYLMERDYWDTLDNLDRALRVNTYLVDYYLLSALALQRTGNGDEARTALANYLEVRPLDTAAPRIARNLVEQDRLLRSVLGPRPLDLRWQLSEPDLQTEWDLGFTRPFNVRGLGKVEALGKSLCIADTLGDRLYVLPNGGRAFQTIEAPRPAVAFPMGDGTFTLFGENGEVRFLERPTGAGAEAPLENRLLGKINATVTDAEWLSENEFAVSDPIARNIAFFNRLDLTGEDSTATPFADWIPPEAEMLFEPVALDRYADWLAVADRGNGRVYVLSLPVGMADRFFFADVGRVRDVLWSPLGELFALTEAGDIFRLDVDFAEGKITVGEPLWKGLDDAWALFPAEEGNLYCLTVAGAKLYKAAMLPSRSVSLGFLGIYHPTVALEANRESFLIDATLTAPFASYLKNAPLVVQSIWNERTVRANAWWKRQPAFDGLLIHRALPQGQALPLNVRPAQVERGIDIGRVLPPLWTLHKETLTNIVVDTSIPLSADDILILTRFCLLNGLELDLWARTTPSLTLTRASAFTGGTTILSLRNAVELQAPRTRLQIQIPLPYELSSSGYPGRSMLAVYLDAGLMQTRAWIPLWPDMLWR